MGTKNVNGVTYVPELSAASFNERGYCTVNMDVELILEYYKPNRRRFLLCKMDRFELNRTCKDQVYAIFVSGDPIPIIITEKAAKAIMKNPEEGSEFVFNTWMDRHR